MLPGIYFYFADKLYLQPHIQPNSSFVAQPNLYPASQ